MADWRHSKVIESLLQRPYLKEEFYRLFELKHDVNPWFRWSERWTRRAEGYPDSDLPPQLQDLLEFFTPDQNASALAQLAYEMGHQPPTPSAVGPQKQILETHLQSNIHGDLQAARHLSNSNFSSLPDKELPQIPSGPPVPPKDVPNLNRHPVSLLQGPPDAFVPWDSIMSTIREDEYLPDSSPLDFCGLDLATLESMHMDTSFVDF